MALHLRHFVLAASLGSAAIAAAYLPPQMKRERPEARPTPERLQAVRLKRLVGWKQNQARLVSIRDQMLAAMAASRSPLYMRVEGVVPAERARIEDILMRQWRLIPSPQGAVPVGITVLDLRQPFGGLPEPANTALSPVTYLLPPATGGPCLVVVSNDFIPAPTQRRPDSALVHDRNALFGPCALYAAFGSPGPAIERWLVSGGARYGVAARVAELAPETPRRRPLEMGGWLEIGYAPFDLTACVAGEAERCRRMIVDSAGIRGVFEAWRAYVTLPGSVSFHRSAWPLRTLLADLVREEGPERFASFWTSSASVDSAFVAAYGVPVGVWAARWADETMGPPPRGVRTDPAAVLVSLACIAILLALAAFSGMRRTVAA